jgi:DNA-binding transcriptional ArsR family regulator
VLEPGGPAAVFAALGDPVRLLLIERLKSGMEPPIGEIGGNLPVTRQAVAKHVAVLEASGLVEIRRHGRERRVRLKPAALSAASRYLDQVARSWDDALGRLQAHLEEPA